MNKNIQPGDIKTGIVGLGLMGSSVVVSMLVAGHEVKAIAPLPEDLTGAETRVRIHLSHCEKAGLLRQPIDYYMSRLTLTEDYGFLKDCLVVLECVIELQEIKEAVYKKIEAVVSPETIIASNTSAIPISQLQKLIEHPNRFLGVHWAEPSYLTRFMEITCGEKTLPFYADWIFQLAHFWGKEPTLLKKDIRGFVTNRLMYAVYREGFHLVEKGEATLEDVDKSFQYDAGSWMTLMGIFRRMDLLGLQDFKEIFKNIFPILSNSEHVPALMQQMIDQKAKGTINEKGLYQYTPEEARKLEDAFALFNEEIFRLAALYPSTPEPVSSATAVETTAIEQ